MTYERVSSLQADTAYLSDKVERGELGSELRTLVEDVLRFQQTNPGLASAVIPKMAQVIRRYAERLNETNLRRPN